MRFRFTSGIIALGKALLDSSLLLVYSIPIPERVDGDISSDITVKRAACYGKIGEGVYIALGKGQDFGHCDLVGR